MATLLSRVTQVLDCAWRTLQRAVPNFSSASGDFLILTTHPVRQLLLVTASIALSVFGLIASVRYIA